MERVAGAALTAEKGLMNCLILRSSDGKTFEVGSDCVRRAGDDSILQAVRKQKRLQPKKRLHVTEAWPSDMAVPY